MNEWIILAFMYHISRINFLDLEDSLKVLLLICYLLY